MTSPVKAANQPRPAGDVNPIAPQAVSSRERRPIADMMKLVNEDPERHYRLVRRDSQAMTSARLKGYDIEIKREGGVRPEVEFHEAGDGTMNVGDTVLMSCPKGLWEKGRRDLHKRNVELMSATDEHVENEARRKGVKTIRDKE